LKLIFFAIKTQLDFLRNMSVGATTKFLTKGMLENLKINLPPLQTQQKIAKILSNYDDLIDNNLKHIKLLKESARLTYEEWFLRFRVEEKNLEIEPSNKLPFGWQYVLLTDYIDLVRGVEPGSADYDDIKTDQNIPFLRVGDLNKKNTNIYVSKNLVKNKIVNPNDILISLDGTPGLVKFGLHGSYSTGIRKAIPQKKKISSIFIFNLLNSQFIQKLIEAYASGTTILHAGSSVKKMKFILPTDKVLDMYNNNEMKKFHLIINLLDKNKILKEARDILLPRLMTGMIDTDDMDIAV
jgi:type I restriction enzyme, S subunit